MTTSEKCPLLSVIIPFYNNERFLDASLSSLFDQIDDDIQVILVNDGSTDDSANVTARRLAHYAHPHVVTINQQNGGIAHARNVGLQHACGQYVTFLDGDDLVSQRYLSTLRPLLLANTWELVDFDYRKFSDLPPEESPSGPAICTPYDFQQQGMQCLQPLFTRSMWHLWNRVYHRSLLVGERFETGRRYEDVIFTPFIYFKTQKIVHIEDVLYFYRDNSQGITRNVKEQDIDDMLFAMQKMLRFAAQHPQPAAIKPLAAMMLLNGFNEVKAMSKRLYGYYFYPQQVKAVLREAAALCDGTPVPGKKVRQMRYAVIDTLLSKLRWALKGRPG